MPVGEVIDEVAAVARKFRIRDPEIYADQLERWGRLIGPSALSGRILAMGLDLGNSCGYALTWARPGLPYDPRAAYTLMGQLDLSLGPYDSGPVRLIRLRQLLEITRPNILFFEDVRYTPPTSSFRTNATAILNRAAGPIEFFGSLKGCIASWAESCGVPCQGFPIASIKKRATGKGNAGKPAVIAGCNEIFGVGLDSDDYENSGVDNVADAAICLLLGMEYYARGVSPGD
jgi:hypothetical protein